jgi:RNA polymerase sigma-70 factor, ECF subfamily
MGNFKNHASAIHFRDLGLRIRNSDEIAFQELFNVSYKPLFNYAKRFISSPDIRKDMLQEAYYKLWQNRHRIDENKSLRAFLYTLVRNECINHIYNEQNKVLDNEVPADQLLTDNHETELELYQLESKDEELLLHTFIKKWINDLPARQREALELSRYDGLDHQEVAAIMNCSPRTVNNHIVAGLKTLRKQYELWKKKQHA